MTSKAELIAERRARILGTSAPGAGALPTTPGADVPAGTVAEVLAWVDGDPGRAQAAYDAEVAGKGRATLLAQLEDEGAS